MKDNNVKNGLNNINPNNTNINNMDMNQINNNSFNNKINDNINLDNSFNNQFWDNNIVQNNINDIQMNNNVGTAFNNVVNNPNVNNNISNSVPDNGQVINVTENFLNVIKENTNDNVMVSNNTDMSNPNLVNNENTTDTFNLNNIDTNQINTNVQLDVNNVYQQNLNINGDIDNQNIINSSQLNINNGVSDTFTSDNNIVNNNMSVNDNVISNEVVNNLDNSNQVNEINNQIVDSNVQNNNVTNQVNSNVQNNFINSNDEELLRTYVGEKYDKIKNSSFSLPTFFLGSLYLFYRKMYLYGYLMMLLGPLAFIGNIILAIKFKDVYLNHANKKINKIKNKNSNMSYDELKKICSKKGGTSIGMVFLNIFGLSFILTIIVVVITLLFGLSFGALFLGSGNIWGNPSIDSNLNNSVSSKNGTLVEDVDVGGYYCLGSTCHVSIEVLNNSMNYVFAADNIDLFKILNDYNDYVKVDIYYTQNGEEKTIVDYKVFLNSNNEDITNIKSEEELRIKLGLYTLGEHTASLTLTKIGMLGAGFNDDESYSYITYTFVDDKNIEYEMEYRNPAATLNLVEGNKYNVTFEVVEGILDYDFVIKEIK